MTRALKRLGYECLGGSEIDEYALDFQRRILGMTEVEPIDFWDDPVSRLTLGEKRKLVLLVGGLPCTDFSQVNALRKGAVDKSAWMTVELLKTLDGPDIQLKAIAVENVPAWGLDPVIPAACCKAAAKHGWTMQIIKVLTSEHTPPRS